MFMGVFRLAYLDLEPQTVVIDQDISRQGQIATEENDVGTGLSAQIYSFQDHDIERMGKVLIDSGALIPVGLHGAFAPWG